MYNDNPFESYGTFWDFAQNMAIRINIQKKYAERARKAAEDCTSDNLLIWEDAFCKAHQEACILETLEGIFHEFLEALQDTEREALLKQLEEFPETRKAG